MSHVCDVCLGPDGEHVSIFDGSGATAATACPTCFDALGRAGCCVCGETTSGKYHVSRDGEGARGRALCATCRRLWLTGARGGLAARIVRLGLSRFTDRGVGRGSE